MATTQTLPLLLEEIAELFASSPTREELLEFHPSDQAQQRARELLMKSRANCLTEEELHELDQFEQAEMLMQLVKVKARLRGGKSPSHE